MVTRDSTLSYTFKAVRGDSSILVKYKRLQYRINIQATNGTISINNNFSPIATVYFDSNIQVNYQPNLGFSLDSIFINGRYDSMVTRDSTLSYTFKAVRGDSSILVVLNVCNIR